MWRQWEMSILLIRQDLVPMVIGYLLVMATPRDRPAQLLPDPGRIRAGARPGRSAASQSATGRAAGARGSRAVRPRPGWPTLVRYVVGAAIGECLVLMADVITDRRA